jgi:molybdopterin-containing oxidoreductase family membrane subunit
MATLTGPLFFSFWVFEIFIGLIVPLWIVLGPKASNPAWVALAGLLPMIGVFVMRYNLVYEGQMFSLKPVVGPLGETLSYNPPFKGNVAGFLAYTPSLVEGLIVAGAIAACILLYVGGTRVLRLANKEAEHGSH